MSGFDPALKAHLATGVTTTCRCWALTRRDGTEMGFTDHDGDLTFEGVTFRAGTGLGAQALQLTTGLSVDNTEAVGALSDAAIRDADIEAGRFDGATIRAWLVNWMNTTERQLQFRGSIGELRRTGGAFEAELRGLTDVLNKPIGRVYQRSCSAVLGNAACRFDLDTPGYTVEVAPDSVQARRVFRFAGLGGFAEGWFRHGMLKVQAGEAQGLTGPIKHDTADGTARVIELWHPLRAPVATGDLLHLTAGCDRQPGTCREKFNNYLNYQGFPDIPGDDWSITDPARAGRLDGGSRRV